MFRQLRVLTALALLACLCACSGPVEGLTGQYEAEIGSGSPTGAIPRLHLRSDGGGGVTAGSLDGPLRWEMREGQVLLHTLPGGIIALKRTDQGLEGTIPGTGRVLFRKK